MRDQFTNMPKTPEGLLAEYIFAQEGGEEPQLDQFAAQLEADADRRRLRELAATLARSQELFPEPLRAQTRLVNRYRLIREIGVGGFGKVWQAADERLDDQPVAVKVLSALASTRDVHSDLERERKALARAQHPGIVPVLDVGEHDGNPFLVMQLVRGITLAELIARLRDAGHTGADGPPPMAAVRAALGQSATDSWRAPPADWWAFCAQVAHDVLDAVQAAHDVGVVHRDIKPGNVMIQVTGEVVLLDFGVARIVDPEAQNSLSGFTGTIAYMAPEQARRSDRQYPERIDVYQVGRVLFELLALQPAVPHALTFGELLDFAREGNITPPRAHAPRVPRLLETICLHALEPDPRRRYGSAGEFRDDLAAYQVGRRPAHVTTTRFLSWSYDARRLLRQHRRGVWMACGLLFGLAVGGAALLLGGGGVTFVGQPERQGRQFVQRMTLPAEDGELFGFVSVLSPLLVEESRIPLRFVAKQPQPEADVFRVVMELPVGAELPEDMPAEQLEVCITQLGGDMARRFNSFVERLLAWMADPINDGRCGVPYETVRAMAAAQARGGSVAPADLLGAAWPRARPGGSR